MNAPLERPIAPLSLTGRIHRDIQQRRTWHLGTPVTIVDITYAGERQHLVGRFSP